MSDGLFRSGQHVREGIFDVPLRKPNDGSVKPFGKVEKARVIESVADDVLGRSQSARRLNIAIGVLSRVQLRFVYLLLRLLGQNIHDELILGNAADFLRAPRFGVQAHVDKSRLNELFDVRCQRALGYFQRYRNVVHVHAVVLQK